MDKKITDLTAQQICDLAGNEMDEEQRNLGNIAGRLNWLEGEMCSWMKLGEKSGGLPINERIEIGNRTIQKLTQLVGALEKSRQVEEVA